MQINWEQNWGLKQSCMWVGNCYMLEGAVQISGDRIGSPRWDNEYTKKNG